MKSSLRIALAQHWLALSEALAKFVRAPLASALTVVVFGIALSLPAGLYAGLANLQRFAGNLESKPQISLFLSRDSSRAEVAAIETRLRQHAEVGAFKFISRERALEELRRSAGLGDVIEALTRRQGAGAEIGSQEAARRNNPLPDAFVIDAKTDEPQGLARMRAEFAQLPKIEDATLDSAWAEKLAAALEFGRLAALFLAALLSLALIAVVFNTIRLQILTLRDEVEVARLVGATDSYIRRPFLYYGSSQGLIGGALACLIVGISFALLDNKMRVFTELYAADFRLRGLGAADGLSLLAFSTILGWLGARLSVGQHFAEAHLNV